MYMTQFCQGLRTSTTAAAGEAMSVVRSLASRQCDCMGKLRTCPAIARQHFTSAIYHAMVLLVPIVLRLQLGLDDIGGVHDNPERGAAATTSKDQLRRA